jgi:hypothetical protein
VTADGTLALVALSATAAAFTLFGYVGWLHRDLVT